MVLKWFDLKEWIDEYMSFYIDIEKSNFYGIRKKYYKKGIVRVVCISDEYFFFKEFYSLWIYLLSVMILFEKSIMK